MPESFGARLRQRREQQDIALATIVAQTKINPSLLEALERDDVSHWPAGIFRRAYIRAYAQAIGLEPDVVVREFLDLHPDPAELVETATTLASGEHATEDGAGPPTRLRYFVDTAIGSLPWFRPEALQTAHRDDEVIETRRPDGEDLHAADSTPSTTPEPVMERNLVAEPDLLAAASLCTALSQVEKATEMAPLLRETARVLDAVGIIVWIWDSHAGELRPALAHGYADAVLAQLPAVTRDTNNATAAAFRSAETCTVGGSDRRHSALVIPVMTPAGCAGVLAIELQHGRERSDATRAFATIFAAQLSRIIVPVESPELHGVVDDELHPYDIRREAHGL